MKTAVLNKASLTNFIKYLRILAGVGGSPSENFEQDFFALPAGEQRIACIVAPIMSRAFDKVATTLESRQTLTHGEFESMTMAAVNAETRQFSLNTRNEKILIELSRLVREQSPESKALLEEGEAYIQERYPDASIQQRASLALVQKSVGATRQMFDSISSVFNEIAGEQAHQPPPGDHPSRTRFKKRK
jgi:hypothetical protein